MSRNTLILIGNGFDLAHGLKTSYKNFIDWYFTDTFRQFLKGGAYSDSLIKIQKTSLAAFNTMPDNIETYEQLLSFKSKNDRFSISYNSSFFQELVSKLSKGTWVDIECFYYENLKSIFLNNSLGFDKKNKITNLNSQFDFLITKLSEYMILVNEQIEDVPKLNFSENSSLEFSFSKTPFSDVKIINFNYTDTLINKYYTFFNEDVIYIHGQASDIENYPLVFGYGDETDKLYQQIEDSGDNDYLTHIKSFAYFSNPNYSKLISYIDSKLYDVFIIGHSCGLSDRVLLSEVFEHKNCYSISVFYYQKHDGSDNFKEITQEISRHFKPGNKNLMRRRLKPKTTRNIIPQNK